ncbi:MAG: hypothetical protein H0V27_11180, partial [Pyrinomonadaceae bacterium]|nr:hypothetical protein [Pyrinomonadaceae bacterium]
MIRAKSGDEGIEKIKLGGDERLIEVRRTPAPDGKPEVVVVTGASAGVGRAVVRR